MLKKLVLALGLLTTVSASASVVILGTRVIYPADQKNGVNIQMNNTSDSPSLVQAWVDEGDADMSPSQTKAPFLLTPPVSRVDGKTGQTLRLLYTGAKALPQDRETVFYLNVLDIPPKPKAEDLGENQNYLQFAVRNRLKLFYRPALPMQSFDAYRLVTWTLVEKDKVEINNVTPYYVTYDYAQVNDLVSREIEMLAPFSTQVVEIPNVKKGDVVKWATVNDYGGSTEGETVIK